MTSADKNSAQLAAKAPKTTKALLRNKNRPLPEDKEFVQPSEPFVAPAQPAAPEAAVVARETPVTASANVDAAPSPNYGGAKAIPAEPAAAQPLVKNGASYSGPGAIKASIEADQSSTPLKLVGGALGVAVVVAGAVAAGGGGGSGGGSSSPGTPSPLQQQGTDDSDALVGTAANDTLIGLGGNDTLNGLAGDDLLLGGDGNNSLTGGAGNDILTAGGGNDTVVYNLSTDGTDLILPGAGKNLIKLSASTPVTLSLNAANAGNGVTVGVDANGLPLAADLTNLASASKFDALNVVLVKAAESANAGLVADESVRFEAASGAAFSVVELTSASAGATVGGAFTAVELGSKGNDQLTAATTGTEYLHGGEGDDTLTGAAKGDYLVGGLGADALLGNAGNDSLSGGAGSDNLQGGAGDDLLVGGLGDGAADTVQGGAGIDRALVNVSTDGADRLDLGGNTDTVFVRANGSADVVNVVFAAADVGNGAAQAVALNANNNTVTVLDEGLLVVRETGTGPDTAASLRFTVNGGNAAFAGLFFGTDAADSFNGVAAQGAIYALGGNGNDVLATGAGNDVLVGGAGNDSLLGGAGADVLDAGLGNNVLAGGSGADRYVLNTSAQTTDVIDEVGSVLTFMGGVPLLAGATVTGFDLVTGFQNGIDRLAMNGNTYQAARGRLNADGSFTQEGLLPDAIVGSNNDLLLFTTVGGQTVGLVLEDAAIPGDLASILGGLLADLGGLAQNPGGLPGVVTNLLGNVANSTLLSVLTGLPDALANTQPPSLPAPPALPVDQFQDGLQALTALLSPGSLPMPGLPGGGLPAFDVPSLPIP